MNSPYSNALSFRTRSQSLLLIQLADTETMKQYFNDLISTVLPLSPVLFYLSQTNVRETITRVAKQRVSEYGSWIDALIQYMENTPYGRKHGSMASMT